MADIPVNASDAVTIVAVTVNGQVNFDYDFRADFVADLKAEYRPANGDPVTVLVGGTDFTATGLGTAAGGTITLLVFATTAGDSMAIYRDITVERGTDYTRDLFSDDINSEQDRIFMILQELVRDNARGIRLPLGYTGDNNLVPEDGTVIGWQGSDLVNLTPSDFVSIAGLLTPETGVFRVPSFVNAAATFIPANVRRIYIEAYNPNYAVPGTVVGGAHYKRVPSEPSHALKRQILGAWWEFDEPVVTLEQCGAFCDGTTLADAAFDIAYGWCMAQNDGGAIVFLAGAGYNLGAAHNIHPTKRLHLHWQHGAKVLCSLTGAASVLFDASHPTVVGTRGKEMLITGPSYIVSHASVAGQVVAKFFKYRHATDLKIDGSGSSWLHYGQNSVFDITEPFNCDLGPMTFWGGGHRKPRKSTGNALFSITGGTTALTSDIPVFAAGDVGDIICIHQETFTISAFTSSTSVTVSEAASRAIVSKRGSFGAVMASGSAGSGAITLSASSAVASDVGRDVYIMDGATDGVWKGLHRATITAVNSDTSITISPALQAAVANAEIIFSPVVSIWHDNAELIADMVWEGLHVEEPKGTCLVTGFGVQLQLPELKLHGNNLFFNENATDYCAVFSRTQFTAHGIAEGIVCGRLGRIVCAGLTATAIFGNMQGIAERKVPYIHARNMAASGQVIVGDITVVDGLDSVTLDRIVTKTGSGSIELRGKVYNNEGVIAQAYSVGPHAKASAIPAGTKHYAISEAENTAYAAIGMSAATTPAFRGIGLNGTPDAPTATSDFQSIAAFEAWGMAPSGSAPVAVARILATARGVAGANIGAELVFMTKLASGALARQWIISQDGILYPAESDNVRDIGFIGGRVRRTHSTEFRPGDGNPIWTSGSGTPEGVVTAPVGSLFTRTNGGAATTLYVKESGAGNTGWVAK